jgi:hypothetical protein
MRRLRALAALLMAGLGAGQVVHADAIQAFLGSRFHLGATDLRELDGGKSVVRSLDSGDDREIATVGVITLDVPPAFYRDRLRDIVTFKRDPAVLQIGVFSNPATLDDVAQLTLQADDLAALRSCRPGDCGMQLSREAIGRFQREVPWRTGSEAAAANQVMRETLVAMVSAYRRRGDRALMRYDNTSHPVEVAAEFAALIASEPALLRHFPALDRHLAQFPPDPGAGGDDIIYWSKEMLGPAVVITVTHLAVMPAGASAPLALAAASKQLYGSRYFEASLGLTALLDDAGGGTTLVYANRSRLNAFNGWFGGVKRKIVRGRVRAALGKKLVSMRGQLGRQFRAATDQ